MIDLDTWLIADTHFGHNHIEEYAQRPEGWDEKMVENINETCRDGTLLILGDYAFKEVEKWTSKIRPKKILIRGNHDEKHAKTYQQYGIDAVIEGVHDLDHKCVTVSEYPHVSGLLTTIRKKRLFFTHLPVNYKKVWEIDRNHFGKSIQALEVFRFDLNVHGHTHTYSIDHKKHFNVNWDMLGKLIQVKDLF